MQDEIFIKNKSQAFALQNLNEDVNLISIKLFDDNNQYSESQLEMLDYVQNYVFKSDSKTNINFQVLYEKLPKKVFAKIFDFYKNTRGKTRCKFVVAHSYKNDQYVSKVQKCWDIDTVLKANSEIEKVCSFIKQSKFTPMEALAYIHGYVQKVAKYTVSDEDDKSWYNDDQFFVGAFMDMPEIVCMGYSALMNQIIETLNMPGLKCKMISIQFDHKLKHYTASHARCFVAVQDEKYDINQTFFDDPTWDNFHECQYPILTHFAMANNCHQNSINNLYQYYPPKLVTLENDGSTYAIKNFNERDEIFDKSGVKINQLLIEKIYFNVLKKVYKTADCDVLYDILCDVTKASFVEQQERMFKGYFAKKTPIMSRQYAQKLFKQIDEKELQTMCEGETL